MTTQNMPGRMETTKVSAVHARWAALGTDTLQQEVEDEADILSYKPRPPLAKPGTYLRDIRYLIGKLRIKPAI
jgi:hypothetical protein